MSEKNQPVAQEASDPINDPEIVAIRTALDWISTGKNATGKELADRAYLALGRVRSMLAAPQPSQGAEDPRTCTCHPSERPAVCQRKYALSECLAAAPHPPVSADAGKGAEAPAEQDAIALRQEVANNLDRVADCCEQELSEPYDAYWMREGAKLLRADLEIASALAPSESVSVSGEVSEEQIDAVWDSLPSVKIHNDATSRGLKTEVLLRRYFARAVLALAGSGGKANG